MNKIDVLNLEWNSYPSRDRNMATLICNYLRYNDIDVVEDSIFKGFEMIDKLQPKLLFMTNGIGSAVNFELVKYASLKGVKVVTLTSEGNFYDSKKDIPVFFWGWNKDQHLYEEINMLWSERTRDLTLSIYPNLSSKIKISGGVGFDYYKIISNVSKGDFLNTYDKSHFSRVIGVGCWVFDFNAFESPHFPAVFNKSDIIRFKKDRDDFNRILLTLIKENPDILFLLKEHPGNTGGPYVSAIESAEKFSNALILKEESIVDCIFVSDFWLTYESTTVIEAWLLGKQTCLLNPSGIDFSRANVHFGSPNYPDVISLQKAVDVFYEEGILPGFADLEEQRKKIIKDTIQWDDGLNHVRAGNEVIRILKEKKIVKRKSIPFDLRKEKWRQYLLSRGIPKKRNNFIYDKAKDFDYDALHKQCSQIYSQQINFYKTNQLSLDDLKDIKCKP